MEERILVKEGCPRWDASCATWVGLAGEGVSGDESVLCCREKNPEVAVLFPAVGTLYRRLVGGEETVGV